MPVQLLLELHAAPGLHPASIPHPLVQHPPFSQTPPGHAIPFAPALGPVSTHTDTPVEQLVDPKSQTLVGVHDRPAVHDSHEPPLQTRSGPQEVPFPT